MWKRRFRMKELDIVGGKKKRKKRAKMKAKRKAL